MIRFFKDLFKKKLTLEEYRKFQDSLLDNEVKNSARGNELWDIVLKIQEDTKTVTGIIDNLQAEFNELKPVIEEFKKMISPVFFTLHCHYFLNFIL